MSKRSLDDPGAQASPKKPKTSGEVPITSARQLQQILAFQQDAIGPLRSALKSFKSFLASIVYSDDKSSSRQQQSILREYLDAQVPQSDDATFLQDLVQAWGFASQTNNDGLLSALTAIFALLLKTISSLIEFRDLGFRLIATILDQAQLKIVSRSLTAPKHKEHLISPALRLLTEAVSFDGGSQARKVYAARSFTFDPKTISRNLSLGHGNLDASKSTPDQPSVRSNAIHYVLANLRFLPPQGKIELLKQGHVLKALFDNIRNDATESTQHVLVTIRESVVKDDAVPRKVKGYIFTPHNLSSIAGIFRQDRKGKDSAQRVTSTTLDFLTYICTDPAAGVLRQSSAFYPPGTIKAEPDDEVEKYEADVTLGLDSVEWYNSFRSHVPVRNGVLSTFLQQLKPYSYEAERSLLLSILKQTPELVADYFFRSSFAFDPKLTATWVGYSAFLFSVVQQSLPPFFGRGDAYSATPPPVTITMESILPQPLNFKVLTRCLNQQSNLVTYFAVRIMVLAFEKFQTCLHLFAEAASLNGSLWSEASQRLIDEFVSRCPKLKDVTGALKKLPAEGKIQREATLRLIMLYYTISPQLASEEKFDVSVILDKALDAFDGSEGDASQAEGLEGLELSHLLRISQSTSNTRWWHKPESLRFSPFVCLLRIVAVKAEGSSVGEMRSLLRTVAFENDILQVSTSPDAVDALLASLTPDKTWSPSDAVLNWVDDVLSRFVKRPLKYIDDLEELGKTKLGSKGATSLVWMALIEQWPFAISRSESADGIAKWLGRFLSLCRSIGEERSMAKKIQAKLEKADGITKSLRKVFKEATEQDLSHLLAKLKQGEVSTVSSHDVTPKDKADGSIHINSEHFAALPDSTFTSADLHRPLSMDMSDAVATGTLGSLMLCLSSSDPDFSSQALANLNTILKRLSNPQTQTSYPQARQLYLLVGVLCNTATRLLKKAKLETANITSQHNVDEDIDDANLPIPYTVSVFAAMATAVLHEPSHPLYAAVNQFLLRGPKWDPARLPSYWVHALLRTPPADTVSSHQSGNSSAVTTQVNDPTAATARFARYLHPVTTLPPAPPFPNSPAHTGAHFLLSYAFHALRSRSDVSLLIRRGALEALLAVTSDPFAPPALSDLVLGLVWRATCVPGGSNVFITRAGIMAWLAGLASERCAGAKASGLRGRKEVKALIRRVWETCDRGNIERWASGSMGSFVEMSTC